MGLGKTMQPNYCALARPWRPRTIGFRERPLWVITSLSVYNLASGCLRPEAAGRKIKLCRLKNPMEAYLGA